MAVGVGGDIEDVCSKCGDCWHCVMAKVGDRIAKVVCKRCGSQHNYRSSAAAGASSSKGDSSMKRTAVKRKSSKNAAAELVAPPFDPAKPPLPYSAKETFATGDRVDHPSFGTGVVSGSSGPGKVDVIFPTGARTLACAKVISTLERPIATRVPVADRPPHQPPTVIPTNREGK